MNIVFWGTPIHEGMAMSNRLNCYCKAIKECDSSIDITVFSEGNCNTNGCHNGINYYILKKINFISPQVEVYVKSFLKIGNFYKATKKADVVFSTDTKILETFFAFIISRINGFKLVQELNENPYLINKLRFHPFWLFKLKRFIAIRTTFKLVDGYISISDKLTELANERKKKSAKIIQVPILCDSSRLDYKPDMEHPYILNSGALSNIKDGYQALLEGFCIACNKTGKRIKFIQTNSSKTYKKDRIIFERIISKYNCKDKVKFLGFLNKDEIDAYQSHSFVGILNKPSNYQNDYNFPTKLGEYLMKGLPVIATTTGELGKYLKDRENAYIINENDPNDIAEKILYVLNHIEEAAKIGEAGHISAMRNFYYSNYSSVIANYFKSFAE